MLIPLCGRSICTAEYRPKTGSHNAGESQGQRFRSCSGANCLLSSIFGTDLKIHLLPILFNDLPLCTESVERMSLIR